MTGIATRAHHRLLSCLQAHTHKFYTIIHPRLHINLGVSKRHKSSRLELSSKLVYHRAGLPFCLSSFRADYVGRGTKINKLNKTSRSSLPSTFSFFSSSFLKRRRRGLLSLSSLTGQARPSTPMITQHALDA